jgi:hypothetical protein
VNLRHRKGYLAGTVAATPARWTNEMAMAVIGNPIGSSAVPMTAYCGLTADSEPRTLLVKLRIDPASLRFQPDGQEFQAQIQVIFAERLPNGSTRLTTDSPAVKISAQRWETVQREGLNYTRRWKPASDAVSLRIVVREMITGQYGTLDVPLKKLPPAQN